MLGQGIPGALVSYGASASAPGGAAGSGGAGPVQVLTANYAAVAADNGKTFTNENAATPTTVTIPAGLALGTTFTFYQNSTTQNFIIQFSGTERLRNNGGTTTAAGTSTWTGAAAATVGCSMTIRVVSTGTANTNYGLVASVGTVSTLA